jgi:hypothetical protein
MRSGKVALSGALLAHDVKQPETIGPQAVNLKYLLPQRHREFQELFRFEAFIQHK